jgi:hypothetical protein
MFDIIQHFITRGRNTSQPFNVCGGGDERQSDFTKQVQVSQRQGINSNKEKGYRRGEHTNHKLRYLDRMDT